jgi:hypothetical protein
MEAVEVVGSEVEVAEGSETRAAEVYKGVGIFQPDSVFASMPGLVSDDGETDDDELFEKKTWRDHEAAGDETWGYGGFDFHIRRVREKARPRGPFTTSATSSAIGVECATGSRSQNPGPSRYLADAPPGDGNEIGIEIKRTAQGRKRAQKDGVKVKTTKPEAKKAPVVANGLSTSRSPLAKAPEVANGPSTSCSLQAEDADADDETDRPKKRQRIRKVFGVLDRRAQL